MKERKKETPQSSLQGAAIVQCDDAHSSGSEGTLPLECMGDERLGVVVHLPLFNRRPLLN